MNATIVRQSRRMAHLHDKPKRGGARENPDESESGGIDGGLFECSPAEQRIASECDHRQQREYENSGRFHY
jgi:hypothetical protein